MLLNALVKKLFTKYEQAAAYVENIEPVRPELNIRGLASIAWIWDERA